ncbi:hypothetical protein Q5425_35620 [Amycolatopsis sp. A133]|uniref:hypothetical protein n=1 Tax=Amycolatopsis sp. A133 TaxID=3064472 RepID=UPI0027E8A62D|nr:hypothetical protein [Amycolatopsis sp. A133]MDQ7809085.1 hypothetical protein [Amycolatopsis sp. A133]
MGAEPLPAVAPGLAAGFRVGFLGRDGADQRLPLDAAAATSLAATLTDLDPRTPADWPAYRIALFHARALLDHTTHDIDTTQTSRLLNALGVYLRDVGTAIGYLTRACDGSTPQRPRPPQHAGRAEQPGKRLRVGG